MSDTDNQLIVAVVALIISVIALSATCMQVLQQYYASASGYSQCNDKVMGEWAKSKSRRFSWEELRFEVQFDAPIIFVSPPNNKNGPILGAPIFFLDGTQKSMEETRTVSEMDLRKEYHSRSVKERIHTADNERASWLTLLHAVQRMEAKSLEWQQKRYERLGPRGNLCEIHGLPQKPPSLQQSHTLTVALQRKRKSWDTMPSTMSKPYATTTMCHLIEIMAALGVYWNEFDRRRDRYRGEGNGFLVLGERISDLGLMFSFQVYGECHFEHNRVIPVDYVKELCFGCVPTIYRETFDQRRLKVPTADLENLGSLQMASRREIAETLVVIGCNNKAVQCYLDESSKTTHLFPFCFEILGMLSQTFHIDHSYFTYIPNPTSDRWDHRSLSLVRTLEAYKEYSAAQLPGASRNEAVYGHIVAHIETILSHQNDGDAAGRLLLLTALHAALDDADEVLTAKAKGNALESNVKLQEPTASHANKMVATPPLEGSETRKQRRRREMVQDVLRSHIQEVLQLLNDRDDRGSDTQPLFVPDIPPPWPGSSRRQSIIAPSHPRFEDINVESPDFRQHKFMEVYFRVIRRSVIPRARGSGNRRASFTGPEGTRRGASVAGAPPGFGFIKRETAGADASVAVQAGPETVPPSVPVITPENPRASPLEHEIQLPDEDVGIELDDNLAGYAYDVDDDGLVKRRLESLANEPVSHDDVWCTLVFRMICWLMLHDFNMEDVQVSKSELLGSRMPVYIA